MNKLLSNIVKHKIKIIIWIIFLTILITIWLLLNNYKIEQENIKIDKYNFGQLEKVKKILLKIPKEEYNFNNLKEFNQRFKQDIKPIKNCYVLYGKTDKSLEISETKKFDSELNYVFLFRIYSKMFINKYNSSYYFYPYYVYPESMYNKIEDSLCGKDGPGACATDAVYEDYMKTISNPCKD